MAFGADAAGLAAADRVYEWEREHELEVRVADLPGVDPADLAREDPAELARSVAEAIPFLRFRLERVLAAGDLSTVEGRARTAEAALDVVTEHPDPLVRDPYLLEVSDRCRVDIARLRELAAAPRVKPADPAPSRRREADARAEPRPVANRPDDYPDGDIEDRAPPDPGLLEVETGGRRRRRGPAARDPPPRRVHPRASGPLRRPHPARGARGAARRRAAGRGRPGRATGGRLVAPARRRPVRRGSGRRARRPGAQLWPSHAG
ncbi:MAG: hypothetical protein R2695_12920 [Acidimicrobiales bacterium]